MIIDASVAFKWLVPEEDSEAALALLGGDLSAPTLLMVELGNAFWKKAVREQIDPSVSFGADLERLPELVALQDETPCVGRALEMARQLGHPIYDCIYLAMAEREGKLLMTADAHFARKARRAGLGMHLELLA